MSKVKCENCGIEFERAIHQIRYNLKTKRAVRSYCSRKCNNEYIAKTRCNEFTPFKEIWFGITQRNKVIELTLQDLKDQWDRQNGVCAYTGVQLQLVRWSKFRKTKRNPVYTASLDRIDSSKGYVKGNVQFISLMANYAKNKFSHEVMLEFCSEIRKSSSTC